MPAMPLKLSNRNSKLLILVGQVGGPYPFKPGRPSNPSSWTRRLKGRSACAVAGKAKCFAKALQVMRECTGPRHTYLHCTLQLSGKTSIREGVIQERLQNFSSPQKCMNFFSPYRALRKTKIIHLIENLSGLVNLVLLGYTIYDPINSSKLSFTLISNK